LTPFLEAHPGGSKVLTNQAGRDGTSAFEVIHPKVTSPPVVVVMMVVVNVLVVCMI
jgi:hypothetical protein